jgi:aspartate/tyrosine/aromatic aminotransferase
MNVNYFADVPLAPPNPIFGVSQECKNDPNPHKIDGVIGAYRYVK